MAGTQGKDAADRKVISIHMALLDLLIRVSSNAGWIPSFKELP
jgi:hypothetical protein